MSQSYKVLVVDDEEVLRDLFQRICTAKGHTVIQARSGQEAVEILKSKIQNPKSEKRITHDASRMTDIDIAFVDIMMPQMDGVATLKALKELRPELPVVMITGFSVDGKIKEAMQLGAIDYLYKPFDIIEVITTLKKLEKRKELKPVKGEA